MSISTQIEQLERELQDATRRLEQERRRNDMQAGALRESRAQNEQLVKRNEQLAAQVARLNKHMRDALGSAEDIVAKGKELQPEAAPAPIDERRVASLADRLRGIVRHNAEAA